MSDDRTDPETPGAEIDPAQEARAPMTREEIVQMHRRRRKEEPAAAAIEPDAEAGNPTGRYAGQPVERDGDGNPVDPARRDPADLRAGPGDAGAQRKPRVLPEKIAARDNDSWRRALLVVAAGAVILGALYVLI
jgi:hypothetical protein